MSTFEEDLIADAEDDRLTVEFIQNYLPQDVKEKFTEDELYYFLDVIDEYYVNLLEKAEKKGVKDNEEMDIDIDDVASHLAKQAKKDQMGDFSAEDLRWVVEGELEYAEQTYDEEEEQATPLSHHNGTAPLSLVQSYCCSISHRWKALAIVGAIS